MRPTQDRLREALFSVLGTRLAGARFLDLFAGSGGVGLEAWSRGAAYVCWVESSPRAWSVLRENVAGLCTGGTRVVRQDVGRFLRGGSGDGPFDLVFADPPYRTAGDEVWVTRFLGDLAGGGWVKADGWCILEQGADAPAAKPVGWQLVDDRVYGGSRLAFYASDGPLARPEKGRS